MRDSDRRLARNRVFDVVRGVRWRWRTRQVLRGLVWVGALTGFVLFASAWGLERLRYAPEWVVAFRYLTWGTLLISTFLFLIRPLFKRVTDGQVALYLEEHEPSLEHAVVSALQERPGFSPGSGGVVDVRWSAPRRCSTAGASSSRRLYRFAGALTGVVGRGSWLFAARTPTGVRHGLSAPARADHVTRRP
jgi:hypothetical protein